MVSLSLNRVNLRPRRIISVFLAKLNAQLSRVMAAPISASTVRGVQWREINLRHELGSAQDRNAVTSSAAYVPAMAPVWGTFFGATVSGIRGALGRVLQYSWLARPAESDLATGWYFVQVHTDDGIFTEKVMRQ